MLIQRLPAGFNLKRYWQQLPDLSLSHILLRIPLSLLFINQGLSKFPFDAAVVDSVVPQEFSEMN